MWSQHVFAAAPSDLISLSALPLSPSFKKCQLIMVNSKVPECLRFIVLILSSWIQKLRVMYVLRSHCWYLRLFEDIFIHSFIYKSKLRQSSYTFLLLLLWHYTHLSHHPLISRMKRETFVTTPILCATMKLVRWIS